MQSVADYEAWKAKQQQANVKASAFVVGQSDGNPDELAGDMKLATDFAAATGNPKPPVPMVSEYRSVFQQAVEKTRAETILSRSPRLTDWLRNQENATLAKDDLETLSWWESAAIVPRGIASALPAFNEGFYNVAGTLAALPGQNRVSDEMFRLADVSRGLKEGVAGSDGGTWLGRQVQGASQSIGMMTPGLLATYLSGGAAGPAVLGAYIAPGAVTQGGQSARAGMDAGLSPERALLYGGTDAAAEVLFERIPVGRLLGDIAQGANFGQIFAGQLAREIPTETATTLFQNFNEWVTLNPDKTVSEFVSEQPAAIRDTVAQTFLATLGVSGLGAGVSRLGRFADEQQRARDAEGRVALFQELSGQSVASKLRERMPERFRDFVERATANGPVESVYVPATEFASYFQTAGIDPYALVDELDGVTRDDLDAALAAGGDLKIPTATYAAKIAGSEHDAFLMENMRFDPTDMTAREAAEFNARVDDIMQEMWDEAEDIRQDDERWRAVEEKIHDQVVSELRAAGLSTERAMAEVQPVVAFYRTRAARMGLTTEEYLARHPLPGVQGAIPQGMQFRNVDELNRTLAEARRYRGPAKDTRQSLLEFIADYGGVNDPGGELKARDAAVIKRPGKSTLRLARDGGAAGQASMFVGGDGKRYGVDDVAQAAIDAGFMADNPVVIAYKASLENGTQAPDITRAFWDAVDAELRGQKQASEQDAAPADTAYLDEIEAYLNRLGVDLSNTDEEIRAAIERDQAGGDRMYGQARGGFDMSRGGGSKTVKVGDTTLIYGVASDGASAEIISVRTPASKRGQGSARQAIASFLMETDAMGMTVKLAASPLDKKTKLGSLVSFYESMGFVRTGRTINAAGDPEMVRAPQKSYLQDGRANSEGGPDYRGGHRAPSAEDGVPASDVAGDVYPEDFYGPNGFRYYGDFGKPYDRKTYNLVKSLRGKPDELVTIYRAVPKGVLQINPGDWVGITREYAVDHGDSALDGEYDILEMRVPARDIFTNGDSLDEWGWSPMGRSYMQADPATPRLFQNTQGPRGQITFNMDGSSMIRLFETANLSTVQHEMGHLFLTMMQRDVGTGDQAAVAEYEVIKSWWRENAAAVAADGNRAMPDAKLTAEDVQKAIDTGTTGDMMKDAAIDVGMQEQWARGYEAYLMEGKAPSADLRGAFEKFRSWLISVYRSMVGLNVNISPEIRGVFDRMLATDEEIAKAKQSSGETAPVFTTAEQMGLTQEEFDRLMKLRAQAEDEAKARLLREVMEPIRREKEKWWKDEKAKVTAEETDRLRRMPVYRAIQEMRFGKTFEGDETPGVKLDRETIEQEYGAGYLPFLPGATKDGKGHRNAVFTEGGIHPDVAAAMYGFQTGRELLDMMSNAPALEDAIKAEVDRVMYERHGDALKDGEIEALALDALHTDKRGEWLAAELKAVTEVAGVDLGMTMKEARETARVTVSRMRVRDARSVMRFLAAERKAGEEAQRIARELGRESVWMQNARRRIAVKSRAAMRDAGTVDAVAGQIDKANASTENYNQTVQKLIAAKRRQLMNHALFMEARDFAKTLEKSLAKTAKLNKTDKALSKSRNVDYIKAARAIASKFGMARPDPQFDFDMWMEQLRFDDPVRADALQDAIAIWSQHAKDYRDLTVSELGAVMDGIENALATGKRFNEIEAAGKLIDREQVVAELTEVFDRLGYQENAALNGGLTGFKETLQGAKDLTSSARAMLRVVEIWARNIDDGKQGPFTNYVVRPVMDALGQYFEARKERMDELLGLIEGSKKTLTGRAIPAPELRGAGGETYVFKNKAALIHAILHTGNDSNKAKFLIGYGFSDGFVNQTQAMTAAGRPRTKRDGSPVLTKGELDTTRWDAFMDRMITEGVITPADIDLVNSIWGLFEKTKRPAQATHKKLKGYYFKEIENRPYQTAAGLLKGGYVPAIIDRQASLDANRQDDMRALDQQSTSMFPTTGAGFTKSRVENYREPLELNLMLLPAHLDDVMRFTYLEPAIRQTSSLVTGRDLRDTLQRYDRNLVSDTLVPWLQRTASRSLDVGGAASGKRRWGRVFDKLRSRVGVSIMFMNVVNTAQQITGPIVAASEISPRRLGRSLVRMMAGDGLKMRQAIMDASPYMAERLRLVANDSQIAMRDLVREPGIFNSVDQFTQKHGYIMQTAFQNVLDVMVWHGAYDQAVSKGLPHADAVFEADSAVRRTMPDSAPENVTTFAQGNVTWRMITMFTSFFISQANAIGGRFSTIRRTMGWNGAPQMFWAYLTMFALPAIVAQAIADAASGAGPEDEDDDGMMDELLAWFGMTQLRYGTAMVPLAGQVTLRSINAFNDNPVDDRLSVSPVVSAIETAVRAPSSIYRAATDQATDRRAVIDGLGVVSMVTGIPTGTLARPLGYGVGVSEGRFNPQGPTDVVQGVISGRDGTER